MTETKVRPDPRPAPVRALEGTSEAGFSEFEDDEDETIEADPAEAAPGSAVEVEEPAVHGVFVSVELPWFDADPKLISLPLRVMTTGDGRSSLRP
mmetsp:Transcript_14160/g.30741  ORF Transcript_14160/g.30741 Transcript_14160/m.30741 type:complete len:95 (+) Transcript_14160:237-521(+)